MRQHQGGITPGHTLVKRFLHAVIESLPLATRRHTAHSRVIPVEHRRISRSLIGQDHFFRLLIGFHGAMAIQMIGRQV